MRYTVQDFRESLLNLEGLLLGLQSAHDTSDGLTLQDGWIKGFKAIRIVDGGISIHLNTMQNREKGIFKYDSDLDAAKGMIAPDNQEGFFEKLSDFGFKNSISLVDITELLERTKIARKR